MKLSERDFVDAAQELGWELPMIKAVDKVESRGKGFLETGEIVLLFEAHIFSAKTGGKYDVSHPKISSPTWNKKLYSSPLGEHKRFQEAISLDRKAALQSASYGRFQIMGFNYKECGFSTVQDFVNAQMKGEREQLLSFVQYIKGRGLSPLLAKKKFDKFARQYNGPAYAANKYDVKLRNAYESFL
jgi:hypothetical protein